MDFPAHDNKRTVGSKCHVLQSKCRQSFTNASMSNLSSDGFDGVDDAAPSVLVSFFVVSVEGSTFFWLFLISSVTNGFNWFLGLWDKFGDAARADCVVIWNIEGFG